MFKKRKFLCAMLAVVLAISVFPLSGVSAFAAVSEEEEEQYLNWEGSIISQYTIGTAATVYFDATVSETTASKYGIVINGTNYYSTGIASNGRFFVTIPNLAADTDYVAYPFADNLVAEEGLYFRTDAATTQSGNTNGYYSKTDGGIAYAIKNVSGTIDIQGANQTKTTYSNNGWALANGNDSIQLYAVPSIVNGVSGGEYVKLTYIARNNTNSPVSGYKFGINSDSMIGTNDSAPVYTEQYGMRVAEGTASNARAFAVITKTSNAADGLGRMVNNVSSQWYGRYSERTSNQYNSGSTATVTGMDSGMALSWQNITLEAGEVKAFSVIFGVANNEVLSKVYTKLATPTFVSKTYNTITVNTVPNQTYFIEAANQSGVIASFVSTESSTHTFTGLTGGKDYKIYTDVTDVGAERTFIPSDNVIVKTETTPAIKNAIEKVASYRLVVGQTTDIVAMIGEKIAGVNGCLIVKSAHLANQDDMEYLSISSDGKLFTGLKTTPPEKRVSIKLTAKSEYSDLWGTTDDMDVTIRVRVTTSAIPFVAKDGAVAKASSGLDHGIKTIYYSYTGDTKKEYLGWYGFWSYGKSTPELVKINGKSGYKLLQGTVSTETSVEDGEEITIYKSTLDGSQIELKATGWYTFMIKDQNNKEFIYHLNIDLADMAKNKPRLYLEDNKVTFVNNNSGLNKVIYQYSGEEPYLYTTWTSYYKNGKNYSTINTNNGYRTIAGTSTTPNVSSLNGQTLRLIQPGYHTFIMKYENNREIPYTVYVSPDASETNVPQVLSSSNGAIVSDNNSGLTKIIYQFSGTEKFDYTTWTSYYTNGRKYSDWNTAAGYKSATGTVEDGVSTLDQKAFNLTKAGWYTFLFTYSLDGVKKETAKTVYIESDFSDVGVAADGFKINYHDSLSAGYFTERGYQFYGENEPDLGNLTFLPDKPIDKKSLERTPSGGTFSFVVPKAGWYVVKSKDNVIGTKYYKVKVTEPAMTQPVEGEDFPVLKISDATINMLSQSSEIKYIRFSTDTEYLEGASIVARENIIYDVIAIDSNGKIYMLKADMRSMIHKPQADKNALIEAHSAAESFKENSGFIVVEDIASQTQSGKYVTVVNYSEFEAAITKAALAVANENLTQTEINTETRQIKAALASYKAAAKIVVADLISTSESAIWIQSVRPEDSLTKVVYNVDQEKKLTSIVSANWANLAKSPYKSVTAFEDNTIVFENVSDGIYTFLIALVENGVKKEYIQYAVVSQGGNPENIVNMSKTDLITEAQTFLESIKKESQAGTGELCITDAAYAKLAAQIEKTRNISGDLCKIVIPEIGTLRALLVATQAGQIEKAPPTETPEVVPVVITENGTSVTFESPSITKISVAVGNYKTWAGFVAAGYKTLVIKDGKATFNGEYNGIHTALVKYSDGKERYTTFSISGITYPFTFAEAEGIITVSYDNIDNVEAVYYGFGKQYTNITNDGILKLNDITKINAMGNGEHTVFVKMKNGDIYKSIVANTSCTRPVVLTYNGKFAAFTNGFSINYVAYAKGNYTGWLSGDTPMHEAASYIAENTWINITESGTYTFYFFTNDGKEYLMTASIEPTSNFNVEVHSIEEVLE